MKHCIGGKTMLKHNVGFILFQNASSCYQDYDGYAAHLAKMLLQFWLQLKPPGQSSTTSGKKKVNRRLVNLTITKIHSMTNSCAYIMLSGAKVITHTFTTCLADCCFGNFISVLDVRMTAEIYMLCTRGRKALPSIQLYVAFYWLTGV